MKLFDLQGAVYRGVMHAFEKLAERGIMLTEKREPLKFDCKGCGGTGKTASIKISVWGVNINPSEAAEHRLMAQGLCLACKGVGFHIR